MINLKLIEISLLVHFYFFLVFRWTLRSCSLILFDSSNYKNRREEKNTLNNTNSSSCNKNCKYFYWMDSVKKNKMYQYLLPRLAKSDTFLSRWIKYKVLVHFILLHWIHSILGDSFSEKVCPSSTEHGLSRA
jgi:hypothetical protein